MGSWVTRGSLLWLVAWLSACSSLPSPKPQDAPPTEPAAAAVLPEAPPPPPSTALTAPLLYDILLGEIAGQRGQMEVSVPHYVQAARDSEDPRVAERALRVAVFAKQHKLALVAARRWVELDADNREAHQVLAALALRQGLVDEALSHLDFLLSAAGQDEAKSFQQLSGMLSREPDQAAALELMALLAERHADSAAAQLAHARLAARAEQLPVALLAVERALLLAPDLTPALVLRARLLMLQGQGDAAAAGLKIALQAQPKDSELRLAYARLLVEVGDVEAARDQFRVLAKREPDNPAVLYSLALLALDAQQLGDARGYFKRLLKLDQRPQEARYYLGQIAEAEGDLVTAMEWYAQVEPGEQWLEVQIRMARVEAEQGEVEQARLRLQELRARDPANALRLYLMEGEILSRIQRYQEAFDLYSGVLHTHPNNDDLLYARSLVAERLDMLELAEQDLRSIIARNPDDSRSLNALGYTLADRTDRYEEALGYIERAAALAPEDAAIIDSLGWVHYRLGNLEQAVTYLQRAYDIGHDAEIAAHLGEVLWMQGDQAAARRVWEAGAQQNPDNPVLRSTLQRLLP